MRWAVLALVLAAALAVARWLGRGAADDDDQGVSPDGYDTMPPPTAIDASGPTPHFSWSELDRDGAASPAQRDALAALARGVLEPIRERLARPLYVTGAGGFHPSPDRPGWPRRGRGSRHRQGRAADVYALGIPPWSLRTLILAMARNGEIPPVTAVAYHGFVHVDLDAGRRWPTGARQE